MLLRKYNYIFLLFGKIKITVILKTFEYLNSNIICRYRDNDLETRIFICQL